VIEDTASCLLQEAKDWITRKRKGEKKSTVSCCCCLSSFVTVYDDSGEKSGWRGGEVPGGRKVELVLSKRDRDGLFRGKRGSLVVPSKSLTAVDGGES
jgi:hypothetical protein